MFGVYKTFAAVTQTTVTKRQQLCGGREKQIQTYGEKEGDDSPRLCLLAFESFRSSL